MQGILIRKKILVTLFLVFSLSISAQITITGTVSEKGTNQPIPGVIVMVKEANLVAQTDKNGSFSIISTSKSAEKIKTVNVLITCIGFNPVDTVLSANTTGLKITLSTFSIPGKEVVITASRYDENLLSSPASIQKIGNRALLNNPTGDFYQGLGNLQGIDVINNSLSFRVFNTRGFNSTSPFRVVQFIDGADNQAVGLNFSAGNLFGTPDIDLESMELVSGPASALYGPNAFQGVINMFTKNPYTSRGVSAGVKVGNRSFYEGQFRIAEAFGKKKRLAVKLAASYMQANEWQATDPVVNRYGAVVPAPQNLNALVANLANDQSLSQADRDLFGDLNTYMTSNTTARPGMKQFKLPGYNETDIFDGKAKSIKIATALHYKISDNMEIAYGYRFNSSTGVYQGNNRASLKDFYYMQHRLQFTWKNLLVKAYTNIEDARNSYDLVLTTTNLGQAAMGNVTKAYLLQYANTLQQNTNGFTNPADSASVAGAVAAASQAYQGQWLVPGTDAFNNAFNAITQSPNRPSGSRYTDKSALQHAEAQYTWKIGSVDFVSGALVRRYIPKSDGFIFSDTAGTDISYVEYGAYTQASKGFFDDKLKLLGSVRVDKSQNYDVQFSPRVGVTYTLNKHNFRLTAQSAFRSPTLNDQYFLLNVGPFIVRGNTTGYDNMYTATSVAAFQAAGSNNPALLQTIKIAPVRPEQIQSIELGYRSIIKERFHIDFVAYVNNYKHFLGSIRTGEPNTGVAGEASGTTAIQTRQYITYSVAANAADDILAYGGNIGLAYYVGAGITVNTNYAYNTLKQNPTDPLIPGFNTPKHKVNFGVSGTNVYKNLGFTANLQWVDAYDWKSSFGDGPIPSYYTVDAQLNYDWKKIGSVIRVGSSNLFNKQYRQAWGAPLVGRFIYASWTYTLAWN